MTDTTGSRRALTRDEALLLDRYRRMNDWNQEFLLRFATEITKPSRPHFIVIEGGKGRDSE